MAFLYPKQFPAREEYGAGCVVETDSDPADLRLGGAQLYAVGVSLEQAMAWIWKSRAFTGSGSGQVLGECCSGSPVYDEFNFPNSQSTSGLDAAKTKMSELICPTSYVTDFVFFGTAIRNTCDDPPYLDTSDCGFSFSVNDPDIILPTPIYLYDHKHYINISYGVAGGFNLNEDDNRTYFAGNFTIDGIEFPLYSPAECNSTPIASFTCTTSLEREAN